MWGVYSIKSKFTIIYLMDFIRPLKYQGYLIKIESNNGLALQLQTYRRGGRGRNTLPLASGTHWCCVLLLLGFSDAHVYWYVGNSLPQVYAFPLLIIVYHRFIFWSNNRMNIKNVHVWRTVSHCDPMKLFVSPIDDKRKQSCENK